MFRWKLSDEDRLAYGLVASQLERCFVCFRPYDSMATVRCDNCRMLVHYGCRLFSSSPVSAACRCCDSTD